MTTSTLRRRPLRYSGLLGELHRKRRGGFLSPMWGRDSDGMFYLDTSLPWVSRDPDGVIAVDSEVAARYGVSIFRDASGVIVHEG